MSTAGGSLSPLQWRWESLRILSLDGGGYLGLATAAFIAEVEDHFQARVHEQFDMFCGTSTGAIIALGLAKGMSGQEIVGLYKRFGPDVFPVTRIGRYLRSKLAYACARYSNRKLADHLNRVFGDATLGSVLAGRKSAMVTAFSLTTGKPRVFKTDHHESLTRDSAYRLADIALASSAAPTYFPIAAIASPANGSIEWFADGGVVANNPAMLGFSEAISTLECHPPDIMLLSISTPRESHAEDHRKRKRRGRGVLGGGHNWRLFLDRWPQFRWP